MPIPTNDDLTPNDWYEITAADESASLPVGTVLQATTTPRANAVNAANAGGHWLADFNGNDYGTIVSGLEFVRHSNPLED
jgi:hypothetical protein